MDSSPLRSRLLARLVEELTAALLSGDAREADLVVRDAIEDGFSEATIDEGLVAPAMRHIGDLWERGDIGVAEEHLATDIAYRVLALQRERFRVARRRTAHQVMLGAVEGEQHVMGLQMAGDLLAHAGFEVRVLGADVPTESLHRVVERQDPDVFGFTATMADAAALLPQAIDAVRLSRPSIGVLVGGSGVPTDIGDSDWLTVVRGVMSVVEDVDALLQRPALN
jgi:MerR family transcriptional regulator, light-induced transcriptional regulator